MFDPINNSTPSIQSYNFQSSFGRVNYFKAGQLSSNTDTKSPEASNNYGTGTPPRTTPEQPEKNSPELHHVVIQYSIHEKTGKTMTKVVDKDNNKVIREIPSREDLERSERLRKYIGRLFDAVA